MSKPPAPSRDGARDGQRIAKLLARAGIASRREIERMIAEGRVAVDGAVLTTPATLLASLRGVTVDGQPVGEPAPARLFRFHKPPGCLTAERDPKGRATIYDRLPKDLPRLIPVGRLDYNTEGLLLLTTDGELKRELELPSTGVARTYRARAFGDVSQGQLEELIHGVEIDGMRYGQIDANLERRTGRNQWIEMTLKEGKNREVRRVLEHLGLEVSRLIRTAYGPFALGDLPPGAVDEVRRHDLVAFRTSLGKGANAFDSPSPLAGEGGARPRSVGDGRVRGRAVSAAQKTGPGRRRDPQPGKPTPDPRAPKPAAKPRPPRIDRSIDRDALIERPRKPRGPAKPAPTKAAPAPEAPAAKPARPKRGAGWAKPKPRSSSRPTPRGGKKGPTRGRPGGGKR